MRKSVTRAVTWSVTGALCLAGAVAVALGDGFPVKAPRLLSGAAWLTSALSGELTLLDGSTVREAAKVPVAVTDVFQQGQNAYAVDAHVGVVRYVDGSTMTASTGVTPIPGASVGLRIFATSEVVYEVDTASHRIALADPVTLAPRGTPGRLATATDPRDIALDGSGRLWAFDAMSGRLSRVTASGATDVLTAAEPGRGVLVMVLGRPVVVDPAGSSAVTINPQTVKTHNLVRVEHLPGDGRPAIGGSGESGARFYPAGNGMVSVCDLERRDCRPPVTLAGAGPLGTPVETGGRLFVPSPETGTVFVVDPETGAVVARARVVDGPSGFELFERDGTVFFNDPMSSRAGVIRPDGTVIVAEKYRTPHPTDRPSRPSSPAVAVPLPVTSPSRSPAAPPSSPPPSFPQPVGPPSRPAPGPTQTGQAVGSAEPSFIDSSSPEPSVSESSSARPILTVRKPAGGVIVSDNGIECGQVCTVPVEEGRTVNLVTRAVPGYELDHWTGTYCPGRRSSCSVSMDQSRTIGAVFRLVSVDLLQMLGEATWRDSNGSRSYKPNDPERSAATMSPGYMSGAQRNDPPSFQWLEFDPRVPWVEAEFTLPKSFVEGDTLTATVDCLVQGGDGPQAAPDAPCVASFDFCVRRPGGRCGKGIHVDPEVGDSKKVRLRIGQDNGCAVVRVRATTRQVPDGIHFLYSGLSDVHIVHDKNSAR